MPASHPFGVSLKPAAKRDAPPPSPAPAAEPVRRRPSQPPPAHAKHPTVATATTPPPPVPLPPPAVVPSVEDEEELLPSPWEHFGLAWMHVQHACSVCCRARTKRRASEPKKPSAASILLTVQPVRNLAEQRCLLDPTSTWKGRWDLLILLLILYSAVSVPLHIGFDSHSEGALWTLEASMSMIFMVDLTLTFCTAYYDAEGLWVRDHRMIALRYLKGWFWIDAPSSVPVELIELSLPPDAADTGSLALLRFLRMFRLVRLLRLLQVRVWYTLHAFVVPPLAPPPASAPAHSPTRVQRGADGGDRASATHQQIPPLLEPPAPLRCPSTSRDSRRRSR